MPPKRKARKTKAPTQTQRQSVVVNIGTKRKSSGRGRLPPPSHQHNLAPTFVTNQQIDYTPLIASILHATAKVQDPVPIRNPVTPLSATTQTAQQMAGAAAQSRAPPQRRAGRSAGNLQPLPSQARTPSSAQPVPVVAQPVPVVAQSTSLVAVRMPDPYYHDQLVPYSNAPPRRGEAGQGEKGGGLPQEGQRVGSQRGRPVGTRDSTPRVRRSSAAISLEKIAKAAAKKAAENRRAAEID